MAKLLKTILLKSHPKQTQAATLVNSGSQRLFSTENKVDTTFSPPLEDIDFEAKNFSKAAIDLAKNSSENTQLNKE